MHRTVLAALLLLGPLAAAAGNPLDAVKKAGDRADAEKTKLVKDLNRKLLDEGRKNQCSFRSGTDELEKGCAPKAQRLVKALVDAKKKLRSFGVNGGFKFVVSGHTDSTGSPEKNKALSARRAAVMVRQLVERGVPAGEIESVGMGSERPREKPDDTPAKRARNRRYEVQVRL